MPQSRTWFDVSLQSTSTNVVQIHVMETVTNSKYSYNILNTSTCSCSCISPYLLSHLPTAPSGCLTVQEITGINMLNSESCLAKRFKSLEMAEIDQHPCGFTGKVISEIHHNIKKQWLFQKQKTQSIIMKVNLMKIKVKYTKKMVFSKVTSASSDQSSSSYGNHCLRYNERRRPLRWETKRKVGFSRVSLAGKGRGGSLFQIELKD